MCACVKHYNWEGVPKLHQALSFMYSHQIRLCEIEMHIVVVLFSPFHRVVMRFVPPYAFFLRREGPFFSELVEYVGCIFEDTFIY